MSDIVEFPRPQKNGARAPKPPADEWEALEQIAVAIDARANDPAFLRQALRSVLQLFPTSTTDPRGRSVGLLAGALLRALADAPSEAPRAPSDRSSTFVHGRPRAAQRRPVSARRELRVTRKPGAGSVGLRRRHPYSHREQGRR
jgi:hypothetical protein